MSMNDIYHQLNHLKAPAMQGSVKALQNLEQLARHPGIPFSEGWPIVLRLLEPYVEGQPTHTKVGTRQILASLSLLSALLDQAPLPMGTLSQLWDVTHSSCRVLAQNMKLLESSPSIPEERVMEVNEAIYRIEQVLYAAAQRAIPGAPWDRVPVIDLASRLWRRCMNLPDMYQPYRLGVVIGKLLEYSDGQESIAVASHCAFPEGSYDESAIAISETATMITTASGSTALWSDLHGFSICVAALFSNLQDENLILTVEGQVLPALVMVLRFLGSRRAQRISDVPHFGHRALDNLLTTTRIALQNNGAPCVWQEALDQDFLLTVVKLVVQLDSLLSKRYDAFSLRALRDTLTEIVCSLELLLVWPNIRKLVASQVRAVQMTELEGRFSGDAAAQFSSAWSNIKATLVRLDDADSEMIPWRCANIVNACISLLHAQPGSLLVSVPPGIRKTMCD
ncbi:hypothetical protein CYLTODRAFT_452754 [Cylindrobasidium torrendii FP15055 ss-10]|uniref:Uncharacterized protein n=1 Tax=Cylindrobasidium torrendii FP15055 ss-10 TaxID=1314674 RepID=A0A0D7BGK9_9AGAR|nr:hypothetical protein CYLTODRAFT_452754 [Cylindrobasidium torrendii FP15055 ss-10]